MQSTPTKENTYCNVAAQALGLDPAGYAGHFADAVLVEKPLPWRRNMYEKAGALPQEMIDLLARWRERYQAGQPYDHRPLMIATDPAYSREGYHRVIFYQRQPGPFARFDKTEYLAPDDTVGPLGWAFFEDRADLSRLDSYRVATAHRVREILVCTHGTVDVACAKFGYPLYRSLRDEHADDRLRVWRVSHFGGHVFAPTLIEMPTGHYWAYVGEEQAAQIVQRTGDVADLRGHYRGWAGLGYGLPQAAKRAMWQREGWAWLEHAKSCTILATDTDAENPRWMELRIDFTRPDGSWGSYAARVEIERTLETVPSTDRTEPYAYRQYMVTRLKQIDSIRKAQKTP